MVWVCSPDNSTMITLVNGHYSSDESVTYIDVTGRNNQNIP